MRKENPKFYNKDLSLTEYSFACGYIEEVDNTHIDITLERDCVYMVKIYNRSTHNRLFWENYESLTEARKMFYSLIKYYFGQSKQHYLNNAV